MNTHDQSIGTAPGKTKHRNLGIDAMVFWVAVICGVAMLSYQVGYDQGVANSVVAPKTCPAYEKQSLATSTRYPNGEIVCSYANSYGKAKKSQKV